MHRMFSPLARILLDVRKYARSNLVRGYARPAAADGSSSDSRRWPDDLVLTADAERRAHFRVSFRRTLAVVVITVVALCGTAALIAAYSSP